MTQEEIAKKILDIRKKKGISKYKIRMNGMNAGTIIAIETGKNVTLENLLRYCEMIGAEIIVKEKEEH